MATGGPVVPRLVEFALTQRALVFTLGLLLLFGGLYAFHLLDVVAYPDPSPPMIEVITQNPSLSAEEIERQITLPIEFALAVIPRLSATRSLSLFGLSDIKFYFDYGSDYFRDRQEVLNRLNMLTLPSGVQPTISPWFRERNSSLSMGAAGLARCLGCVMMGNQVSLSLMTMANSLPSCSCCLV